METKINSIPSYTLSDSSHGLTTSAVCMCKFQNASLQQDLSKDFEVAHHF